MSFRPNAKFGNSARIEEAPRRRGGHSVQRLAQAASAPASAPDAAEAADLYYRKFPRGLAYLHFDSTQAAVTFLREKLSAQQIGGAVLQVGERRYQGGQVAALVKSLGEEPGRASAELDA